MNGIPFEHGLIVAAILFSLGLCGLLLRRNLLFILMSIEVLMNACAVAFVVAGSRYGQVDGQIMYILVISLAAAVASIALSLLMRMYRRHHTLNVDAVKEMRG